MTATGVLDDRAIAGARPLLDGPERASLRDRVRAEVASGRPRPVAVRTLELLAEAAAEPCAAEPGYRILDRHGAPRMHERAGEGGPVPMTLADLVADLQARHPALFLPPLPAPEPEPTPLAKDASLLAGTTEMRAATARFVETQSERARSLAGRSSVRGRALARSVAGAVSRFGARSGPTPTPMIADVPPASAPDPVAAWNVDRGRFGRSLRWGLDRLRETLSGPPDETGRLHRRWLVGASAAALVAVAAAGLVVAGRPPPGALPSATSLPPRAPSPTSEPPPAQTARAPLAPDTVTPPPESGGDPEPDTPPAPPAPNAVTGAVQVIDTATLRIAGKLVHLFGVEWVRGGQADELTRYIAGRPVTCQPAPGSDNMTCTVDGRDLSEVVLFNGGGRASPEASPELVAAEDHARSERLGVWKR